MLKNLTTIIVISFVTVSAIFLISVSVISYKVFFNFTSKEISEARLTLVNEGVRQISAFITRVSDAGIYIVTNRRIIGTFSDESIDNYEAIVEQRDLTQLINDIVSFQRGIHSIELYTDRYNQFPQVIESKVFPLKEIQDESWFERFNKMDSGWIPKHKSTTTNQDYVSYLHRLVNQSGRTMGFVKINVLPNTFFEYMSDEELVNDVDGSLLLLDSGGRIIDRMGDTDHSEIIDQIVTFEADGNYEILKEPYSQFSNHHELLEQEKNQYLFILSKPTNEKWRLVHLINIDSLYSKIKKVGFTFLVMGILCLVLLIPISYWLVRRLMKPITELIEAMKKVEKGDFQARVEPGFIEEYKVLAVNFNHMTYQLGESLKDLERGHHAKREAEIKALQNQIAPHFLYNTLDMIHWRALDYHASDISYMVIQLSKMFRIGLSGGQTFIPLRDELEHAQCYIDIQSARLNVDIKYDVKVDAKLRNVYIPKIILQPFIENSIKHGYPHDFDKSIDISVFAKSKESYLEIDIADNGIGLPKNWSLDHSNGIGIKNIQERIFLFCGKEYGVDFLKNTKGGTIVRIRLPLINNRSELKVYLDEEPNSFN